MNLAFFWSEDEILVPEGTQAEQEFLTFALYGTLKYVEITRGHHQKRR
jgi:hypothetical protein